MIIGQGRVSTRQGEVAYIEFGSPAGPPVIALHGWLDNAASFVPLGEHFQHLHVYALDCPGHGHSYHRPFPYSYQLWDDLLDILDVADALGLGQFALLGHSRGASICALLAGSSDRVCRLALLDGLFFVTRDETTAPESLQKYLLQRQPKTCRSKTYPSLEAMVQQRMASGLKTSQPAVELIVKRNAIAVAGGYQWRTARSLRWRNAAYMTTGTAASSARAINCPSCLWVAANSALSARRLQQLRTANPAIEQRRWPGNHHFHMETQVPALAAELERFFN